jgi:hypothetical protein
LPAFFERAKPIRERLRLLHVPGEFAGIVALSRRGPVRHRARTDEIAPAQHIGSDAEIARGNIDQALDHVGRFRPPGTTIGIDRERVGVGRADADMADRNVVDARQHSGAEIGDERRVAREIGAQVGDGVDLEREETRVLVECQRRGRDVVAAVCIAQKMLAASRHPFDRPP